MVTLKTQESIRQQWGLSKHNQNLYGKSTSVLPEEETRVNANNYFNTVNQYIRT
jgi:hypothetical protein